LLADDGMLQNIVEAVSLALLTGFFKVVVVIP
jgi:hypothetical protein